jgi:microcystin-dependent protein
VNQSRRTFFKLAGAAAVAAAIPKSVSAIIESQSGGWMVCDGSELLPHQFPDLFRALGRSYGGTDGKFCLPLFSPSSSINPKHIIKVREDNNDQFPLGSVVWWAGERLPS